jgi:methyl-accepting chemotaxis protein
MKRRLKLKTRGKLIVGFAIVLIATFSAITLTYNNIRSLDRANLVVQELDITTNEITSLRSDLNRIRSLSLYLFIEKEASELKNIKENIIIKERELLSRSLSIEEVVFKYMDGDNEYKEILSNIHKYLDNRLTYIELLNSGKRDEAYAFIKNEQNICYDKIRSSSLNLENSIQKIRSNYIKINKELKNRLSFQILLFGSAISLLILLLSIFIIRMIRKITAEIRSGIEILAYSSSNILTTITEISAGASETAAAVSETTTTIEEVRQTATMSNQKAKSLIESSQKVSNSAEKGKNSLDEVITGMEKIDYHMKKISDTVVKLSEQNRRIGEITSTVSDIADQSNLLAVNAAIEAAKAGEHGRGFTVVAQEIRNLADQSKRATIQVKEILHQVNKSVENAVEATDEATKTVEAGKELVMQSGEVIDILAENIEESGEVSLQISSSNHQQMAGMDQIVPAMENIKKASEQNVNGMQQAQSATQEIHNLGQTLKKILIKYDL